MTKYLRQSPLRQKLVLVRGLEVSVYDQLGHRIMVQHKVEEGAQFTSRRGGEGDKERERAQKKGVP